MRIHDYPKLQVIDSSQESSFLFPSDPSDAEVENPELNSDSDFEYPSNEMFAKLHHQMLVMQSFNEEEGIASWTLAQAVQK